MIYYYYLHQNSGFIEDSNFLFSTYSDIIKLSGYWEFKGNSIWIFTASKKSTRMFCFKRLF